MSFTVPAWMTRDVAIVVGARALSLLGDEVALVALLLRLHDDGAGTVAIAALFTAGLAPIVVLAPLVGRIVDRVDSSRLLVASSLAQAAVCLVLAHVHSTVAVLALVSALGTGQALNGATWQSLLPHIVGVERLAAALGLSQVATTGAGIAAPPLGGVLTGLFGASVPLYVDAASFLAVTAGALLLRVSRHPGASPHDEGGGLRAVRADRLLTVLLTMLAVFVVLSATVNVVEVFLVRDTLAASATWYGVVGGCWALGMVLGSILAGRLHEQAAFVRMLVVGALTLATGIGGYSLAPSVGWLVPTALAGGTGNGVVNVCVGTLVMTRAPESVRGRVSAAVAAIASGAMIGSYALGALLARLWTPRQIFAVSGLLGLVVAVLFARILARTFRVAPAALSGAGMHD